MGSQRQVASPHSNIMLQWSQRKNFLKLKLHKWLLSQISTRWRTVIWLIWIRNSSNTCLAPFHQVITVPYDNVMKYRFLNRANVLVVFIQLLSSSWIFVCWSQCCSLCLILSLQHIIQSHSSSLTSSSYQKCIFWYQSILFDFSVKFWYLIF